MTKGKSYFWVGLLIGVILTSFTYSYLGRKQLSSPGQKSVRVLKMAHGLSVTHPVHEAIMFFAKRLEELSGGQLSIQVYPSGQLGNETKCLEQLQLGTLDLTKTSAGVMGNFVNSMKVFSVPYIFRDEDHYWSVLDGKLGGELLDILAVQDSGALSGFKGVCYYDSGSRNFYTNIQVKKPADLKGLKIRTMKDPVAMDMVHALGGSPTPIPWGELYTALKQGVVDGAENNPPSIVSSRHYEACKFLAMDHHSRIPDIVLMSAKKWDTLSLQEQGWLMDAAEESKELQKKLWKKASDDAMDVMRKNGVTILDVETALFKKASMPAVEKNLHGKIKELYEKIQTVSSGE
jgi:tripartite ATP-independent transporter DctP family solute receptor